MVKLDFNLERDVPELRGKVLLITGGQCPCIDTPKILTTLIISKY